jgi:hypothetical protein
MPGLTLSGVPFLTGQRGMEKAALTGTSSLRSRRRAGRRTAKGPGKRSAEEVGEPKGQKGRGTGFFLPHFVAG